MLQHVALETRPADAEPALAFWALLGFTAVEPPPGLRGRTAWVQRGPSQVHLLFTDDPVAPPAGHAAVVVEDYAATVAALRGAGHAVEPRTEYWGVPRAFVTAPGGHRVEIMAATPA